MKYELCYAYSVGELEEYINKWLVDGWKLYGSPFAVVVNSSNGKDRDGNNATWNEVQYVQAMVKEDNNER